MRKWCGGILSLLATQSAFAYFEYAPNRNLIEEVEQHSYRILPRSNDFAIAIDGDFFKPVFLGVSDLDYYRYDFYHGNGYWVDLRSEFRPNPNLVLDMRTSMTQGTTSNGPTFNALLVPRLGLTYRAQNFLGLNWETRLSDIDRQTVGTGLFIEQKETSGGYIMATGDEFSGRVMVDGTGSFSLDGGVVAFELDYLQGLIGTSVFMLERDIDYRPPQFTGTIFSKKSWNNGLSYGLEAGVNNLSNAGMIFLSYETNWSGLKFKVKPQFRHYGKKIMGDLAGNVSHTYIGYDQNDKPFTSFMNIMAYGDHVETYSTQLDLDYRFNSFYGIFGDTELLSFAFHDRSTVGAVFYRTGFRFLPFRNREDQFCLLVGNKYLIASTLGAEGRTFSPPNQVDFENKPLFMQQTYWMINYSIKL